MNKGLTISLVFEANSANFGESFGNIAGLKKLTRGGGNSYTYISRQAIRYNIVEQMGCSNTPVEASGSGAKKVIQFKPDATIADYPEIDLFGYMKTIKGENADTRSAVVRLSHAVSLETFASDLDFQTNMGLSRRIDADNSIAQSEIHKAFYAYTLTIDLDKVGVDKNIEISSTEKASRIKSLLKTVQYLYRDIRGRRENLAPVFAIGGIYERKNPFFENRIKLKGMSLNTGILKDITDADENIKNNTVVGYIDGVFASGEEISKNLKPITIGAMFEDLCRKVEAVYNESH